LRKDGWRFAVPTNDERLARLDAMREQSLSGGGAARIGKQHAMGKLTARERLELLLDAGSFVELDRYVIHRVRNG
jgi:propionyl-CoA carboxylase beta chain